MRRMLHDRTACHGRLRIAPEQSLGAHLLSTFSQGSNKRCSEVGHFILHWHHRAMPEAPAAHNQLKSQQISAEPEEVLPRNFDRYLLLKRIARGGMGEVFLATPSGTIDGAERPCVLKVIRREHIEDSSFLARFLDEAASRRSSSIRESCAFWRRHSTRRANPFACSSMSKVAT